MAWTLLMQNNDIAMALKNAQQIMAGTDRLVIRFPSLRDLKKTSGYVAHKDHDKIMLSKRYAKLKAHPVREMNEWIRPCFITSWVPVR